MQNTTTIFQIIAERHGVTVEKCLADMQEAIDAAWNSEDPVVRQKQQELFPNEKPSIDKFVLQMAQIIQQDLAVG